MKLLPISFGFLQLFGFWVPFGWTGWKKWLYNCYSMYMVLTLYFVTLTQLIALFTSIKDIDEFVDNSTILLTTTNACIKVLNIVRKRDAIIKLVTKLLIEPCCPRDEDEQLIQDKFDKTIKHYGITYIVLTESAVALVVLHSIVENMPQREMVFKTWLPYDINNSPVLYWVTYIHQLIADILGSLANISYDTLVPGCMTQTCAQFEIFKYRLKNIYQTISDSREKEIFSENQRKKNEEVEQKLMAEAVKHHLEIFNFAETTNDIFAYTIFFQFSVSLIVICTSVYGLSSYTPFSTKFTSIMIYLLCMTAQIYIFCFYGDAVTQNSIKMADDIYEMNWDALTIPSKKSIILIMLRTSRPIQFTSGHVVVLSLDSFNKLLKLSYSAYNFLTKTR